MTIPEPVHNIGDKVKAIRGQLRIGVIHGRSFDNLLHAKEWRYVIHWSDGRRTNNHYCYDLIPVTT